jgi:hypothetical protein
VEAGEWSLHVVGKKKMLQHCWWVEMEDEVWSLGVEKEDGVVSLLVMKEL